MAAPLQVLSKQLDLSCFRKRLITRHKVICICKEMASSLNLFIETE